MTRPAVDLWLVDVRNDPRAAPGPGPDPLSPGERERAARFRDPALGDRWAAGRRALRRLLAEATGLGPGALRLLPDQETGRPRLADAPDLRLSLARAGDHLLVALRRDAPVGVDLEPRAAARGLWDAAPWVLSPAERAALAPAPPADRDAACLAAWVAKEAYLKGVGLGLGRDPATLRLVPAADGSALVDDPAEPVRWLVLPLLARHPGLAGALAVAPADPPRVRWHP